MVDFILANTIVYQHDIVFLITHTGNKINSMLNFHLIQY